MVTLSHRYKGIVFNDHNDLVDCLFQDEEMKGSFLSGISELLDFNIKIKYFKKMYGSELYKEYLKCSIKEKEIKRLFYNFYLIRFGGQKVVLFEYDGNRNNPPTEIEKDLSKNRSKLKSTIEN